MSPYTIAGLAIVSIFYVIYILKFMSLSGRGISADRLGSDDKPRSVRRQERLLQTATLLTAAVQYITLASDNTLLPITTDFHPLQIAGCVLGVTGTAYFAAAVTAMRDNWRAGIDAKQHTELVTGGIYRFSRNPAFTGFDLMYAGVTMICPNWPLAILSAATIVLFHLQILKEEAFLADRFGEEYDAYKRRTLRY